MESSTPAPSSIVANLLTDNSCMKSNAPYSLRAFRNSKSSKDQVSKKFDKVDQIIVCDKAMSKFIHENMEKLNNIGNIRYRGGNRFQIAIYQDKSDKLLNVMVSIDHWNYQNKIDTNEEDFIYDIYVICSDYSKYFTKKNVIKSLKKIKEGTFFSKDDEEFIESEKNSIERLKYIYSDYF
jgi:hypothetical protein